MEKMTNKKALEFVLGLEVVVANEEVYAKLCKMLEQTEKKNKSVGADGKKSLTVDQKKNEELKSLMVEEMVNFEPMQIKDMLVTLECLKGKNFSNQKISALLKQLVADGTVLRIEDKKVTKFGLPVTEEEEEVTEE